MCFSATASRSLVVSPGRTVPRSSSSVSPTTSPARRMARTWSVLLYWIRSRPSTRSSSAARVERGHQAGGHVVDLAHALPPPEQRALAVHVGERRGLLRVDGLPASDDVLGVVRAPVGDRPLQQAGHDLVLVGGQLD